MAEASYRPTHTDPGTGKAVNSTTRSTTRGFRPILISALFCVVSAAGIEPATY